MSKKPIRDSEANAAKKELGGNTVLKGVVVGGDGPELVFQIREETKIGTVSRIIDSSSITAPSTT